MKSFFGKTLFPYAVTLFGYCFAYFFRSYLHFYDKPSGEMFVSLFLVAASTFAFGKIIRRNPKLRSLVLLLIPLALFSLNGFFWFYSQSDFLLVYNYAALISLGASLAAAFKFPITEKKFWVHYIIIWFFGGAGFLISFYSKEFDFAGTLICLITLGYVASQWEKSKVTRIGVVVITILLLILSIKNPAPKFFERQDKYEDLVVFSNETEFQTVDITTWKGNYWFYQNGVNHFSSIDSWLYYEPFVYPVLAQNNPQRILIIGGENGMLAAELQKQNLEADLLPLDQELVQLVKDEALFTAENDSALFNSALRIINQDPFTFLGSEINRYDLIYIDAPDPVDILTNQFYTQEFYELVYSALTAKGQFVTQSGSPYFATQAYEMIKRTIASGGFAVTSYHNQVLTLGEWSWTIGTKQMEGEANLEKANFESFNTLWLNNEAMKMMLSFGKIKVPVDSSINTIADPLLYEYYLDGNFGLK